MYQIGRALEAQRQGAGAGRSLPMQGNQQRRWQSSWTFNIYNVYLRVNPISLNFLPKDDGNGKTLEPYTVVARKTYLFGFLPAVTYNFKF